ncbi:hypothetical protein ACIRBY_23220 [Streptomyces sp. NPDC096136]|uniref:hypothetical protein n=1 Tax=Streptomyces sp. NPDC096136 TaxID=3366076 RepID=UPI00382B2959
MRIRMTVEMSGTRNGEPWPRRGEVTELPTAEAAHLVGAGIAERVDDVPAVETATAPAAESAPLPDAEAAGIPAAEERRGRGRPRKPRDADGNIIRE